MAHWAVLIFVLTAWLSPWPSVLWLHVVFVPLMLLHWKTNENRCVLSELEEKYKSTNSEIKRAEESQFIKMVWMKIFGRLPTEGTLDFINYGLSALVWLFSVVRLWIRVRTS